MEHKVHRFRFRIVSRGVIQECDGRSIESPDGKFNLQVWMRTPEEPDILLEVEPMEKLEDTWPLFRLLCQWRGVLPHEYRVISAKGEMGEWTELPAADAELPPPQQAKDIPLPPRKRRR